VSRFTDAALFQQRFLSSYHRMTPEAAARLKIDELLAAGWAIQDYNAFIPAPLAASPSGRSRSTRVDASLANDLDDTPGLTRLFCRNGATAY
jgi:hypothetical protein